MSQPPNPQELVEGLLRWPPMAAALQRGDPRLGAIATLRQSLGRLDAKDGVWALRKLHQAVRNITDQEYAPLVQAIAWFEKETKTHDGQDPEPR